MSAKNEKEEEEDGKKTQAYLFVTLRHVAPSTITIAFLGSPCTPSSSLSLSVFIPTDPPTASWLNRKMPSKIGQSTSILTIERE